MGISPHLAQRHPSQPATIIVLCPKRMTKHPSQTATSIHVFCLICITKHPSQNATTIPSSLPKKHSEKTNPIIIITNNDTDLSTPDQQSSKRKRFNSELEQNQKYNYLNQHTKTDQSNDKHNCISKVDSNSNMLLSVTPPQATQKTHQVRSKINSRGLAPNGTGSTVEHRPVREVAKPTFRAARASQTAADKANLRSHYYRRLATNKLYTGWSHGLYPIPGLQHLDSRPKDRTMPNQPYWDSQISYRITNTGQPHKPTFM